MLSNTTTDTLANGVPAQSPILLRNGALNKFDFVSAEFEKITGTLEMDTLANSPIKICSVRAARMDYHNPPYAHPDMECIASMPDTLAFLDLATSSPSGKFLYYNKFDRNFHNDNISINSKPKKMSTTSQSITEHYEHYFAPTFTTKQGDWEVRDEVKFRFGAAFIKYATAHPQPKPIHRLHSAHKVGELKAVASNLSAAYLRNKCPHGLGALALAHDTLTKVSTSNDYTDRCVVADCLNFCITETEKAASPRSVLAMPTPPTPPPNNGITIDGVEILAHNCDGYGVAVRHNPQGDYPTYNPTNDDGHNMLLPENLIKKILRMRPNLLGEKMKTKMRKYHDDHEHAETTPPFSVWLKMDKRRRTMNKKRHNALCDLAQGALIADNTCDHINTQRLLLSEFQDTLSSCIDRYEDCPQQMPPLDYHHTFFDAQARFEHTRIALYYEERRQMIARGLINPLKITNNLGAFDKGDYAKSCLTLLSKFTYAGICGAPGTAKAAKIGRSIARLVQAATANNLSLPLRYMSDNETTLKITYQNKTPRNGGRAPSALLASNCPKITRKNVLGCGSTVALIQKMFSKTELATIAGSGTGGTKMTTWKKCVPFVITRFNYFDEKQRRSEQDFANDRFTGFFFDTIFLTRGKNPRGVKTPNGFTLYEAYFNQQGAAVSNAPVNVPHRYRNVVSCEIACYKAWAVWNCAHPNARMFQELKNAPARAVPHAEEEIVYGGKVLIRTEKKMPKYGEWAACSKDLRLPYLTHEGADGVRLAELEYQVNDLPQRFTYSEDPRRRRESCCLVRQTQFNEHALFLDGGIEYCRIGWGISPLTNGDCPGLLTEEFHSNSRNTDVRAARPAGKHDPSTGFWMGC